MFKLNRAVVVLSIGLAMSAAGAAGVAGTPAQYGSQALNATADREIAIDASTKWINVTDGETVQFTKNGHSFTWHFATLNGETSFQLSQIAPLEFNVEGLRVLRVGRDSCKNTQITL